MVACLELGRQTAKEENLSDLEASLVYTVTLSQNEQTNQLSNKIGLEELFRK